MKLKIRRWPAAAAAGVAALAALVTLSLPTAGAQEPDTAAQDAPGTLAEIWRSDFEGPAGSLPAGSDWIIDTGTGYPGGPPNWGTGEIQTYTDDPANIQLNGSGQLEITALRDGDAWTSARIETQRADFAAPEGGVLRIEASLKRPDVSGEQALGYWPAFWTLGGDYRGNYWNWPGIGEFDIMENVNGLPQVWGVLHCGVNPGGPCNETNGIGASTPCDTCGTAFHEYAIELDRTGDTEYLRWYLDGQEYHSVSSADMDAATWANATDHGHFILLNLAMGGAFPNGVAGQTTPTPATVSGGKLTVDYVSVSVTGP
ncbi:glycoside hydrolase family 16 protein [Streptomyces johnsoniae]|uniref:Glycoside hydrolase family 16 protein n=1 Tax=Streptomyces johnsoniae TaxID=3075532 RepID=A0ABU2S9K1_9ACTN|nr:glycoside hydrolase family 16 protein [Streptomyces sp. DSM 41886]MDT0445658.1 glycoside hydrolase family 16 protein [Streptomyces sp. DSM 41886]